MRGGLAVLGRNDDPFVGIRRSLISSLTRHYFLDLISDPPGVVSRGLPFL